MAAHARVRTRPAPRHPRRISGPIARPVPAGAPPLRRGSTGVFERIRALPETRLIDGLLRGRAWIWLIGLLLGGIVAMQVSLLKLNAGISNAVTTASTLERQNADLETEIAQLSSIERVRDAATADDMVTPAPGAVGFLHARGDRDATLGTRRRAPPCPPGGGGHRRATAPRRSWTTAAASRESSPRPRTRSPSRRRTRPAP